MCAIYLFDKIFGIYFLFKYIHRFIREYIIWTNILGHSFVKFLTTKFIRTFIHEYFSLPNIFGYSFANKKWHSLHTVLVSFMCFRNYQKYQVNSRHFLITNVFRSWLVWGSLKRSQPKGATKLDLIFIVAQLGFWHEKPRVQFLLEDNYSSCIIKSVKA